MSSLTTTKIDTANGTTNLTVTTGNTSGPAIVVSSGTNIALRANATANIVIANSIGLRVNTDTTFVNSVIMSNTLSVPSTSSLNVVTANTYSGNVVAIVTATANVYSGNVVSVNVATISTNTLTLGTSSISTTGYSRLPNGLLYQWGSVSATTTTGDVTFPVAFTSIYSLTATAINVGTVAGTLGAQALVVNTTVAQIRTANTTAKTVNWMAIGV